jgi:hypothetical protein
MDAKNTRAERPRVFVYHSTLSPLLALLLVAPLLFIFLSFAAMLLAGGAVAALFVPLFLRGRLRRPERDTDVITLDRDQYSHVDRDTPKLPPR